MHPDTPDLLNRLLARAERTIKTPSGERTALALCEDLVEEVAIAAALPSEDGRRLVDESTLMLAQCLLLLEREGPLGERRMKFEMLARAFLPFVKTDTAIALDLSRPRTTEQAR